MCGSTCFRRLPARHQEHTTALAAAVLLVVVWQVNLSDHDQQHCNCHSPMVKPEAASAAVCSWWWVGRRPKHVEPTHKHQVINLWNCCTLLVDLFESYNDARTRECQICILSKEYIYGFHIICRIQTIVIFWTHIWLCESWNLYIPTYTGCST